MTEPTSFEDFAATRGKAKDVSAIGAQLKSKLEGFRTDLEALYSQDPEGGDEPGKTLKKSHRPGANEFLAGAPEAGTAIDGVGQAVVNTVNLVEGVDGQGAAKIHGAVNT